MTKKIFLAIAFLAILSTAAWAQTAVPVNEATAQEILTAGILGIGVLALTEMVKRFFKAGGLTAYLISAAVSLASTAVYLVQKGAFKIPTFLLLGALVFLIANGLYKTIAKT